MTNGNTKSPRPNGSCPVGGIPGGKSGASGENSFGLGLFFGGCVSNCVGVKIGMLSIGISAKLLSHSSTSVPTLLIKSSIESSMLSADAMDKKYRKIKLKFIKNKKNKKKKNKIKNK